MLERSALNRFRLIWNLERIYFFLYHSKTAEWRLHNDETLRRVTTDGFSLVVEPSTAERSVLSEMH